MNTRGAKDPIYAWVMVISVFILSALSFGTLASISVFLKPLSLEFGWSRADTSLAYTVISFSSAAFGIFWGYIGFYYQNEGYFRAKREKFCFARMVPPGGWIFAEFSKNAPPLTWAGFRLPEGGVFTTNWGVIWGF